MSEPFDVKKIAFEMGKDFAYVQELVDELDGHPATVVEKAYEVWRLRRLQPVQDAVDALTPNLRALFRARLMNGDS